MIERISGLNARKCKCKLKLEYSDDYYNKESSIVLKKSRLKHLLRPLIT